MNFVAFNMANEKRFVIVGNAPTWMRDSYSILKADFHEDPFNSTTLLAYGTVIEVYTTEEVFQKHALMCDMMERRYFAFLFEGDTLVQMKTIADFTDNSAPSAFIAIPYKDDPFMSPPGFYSITYPHITLISPTQSIHKYVSQIGLYHEYKLSELLPTCNTLSHHVIMKGGNHITRAVRNGKKPVITANEIVPGYVYTNESGYSILM